MRENELKGLAISAETSYTRDQATIITTNTSKKQKPRATNLLLPWKMHHIQLFTVIRETETQVLKTELTAMCILFKSVVKKKETKPNPHIEG